MSNLPLITIDRKVFDYTEDKSFSVKLVNCFGKEIKDYSVQLFYKIKDNQQINTEDNKKSDFDLEEEGTPSEEPFQVVGNVSQSSIINLPASELIKKPGKFTLELNGKFSNSNIDYTFSYSTSLVITSISKIKLNHLKMALTSAQEKSDEKEITVEYPKRSFKNIKANQNSVLKLKVKLNSGDNQVDNVEQIFLKLRHNDLGKAYSAYFSEYKQSDDYYYINFDFNDSVRFKY